MVNLRSKCVICGTFLKQLELLSKYPNPGKSCCLVSFPLEAVRDRSTDLMQNRPGSEIKED